jgi:hypothetical protein
VLPDYVNPDERRPLSSGDEDAGTSCSSNTLHQAGSRRDTTSRHPRFWDAAESGGMGARMESRSQARETANTDRRGSRFNPHLLPHSPVGFQDYARLSSTPNPYYGERDSRNEAARSDPRRYGAHVPPFQQCPLDVDIDYGSDDGDHLPQGGQIISPRHWDRRQQAQLAGHSPLDAAALGCKEYHGYQHGYYPLTADIILCCGYRDSRGGVTTTCNDIIFLHRRVLDAWVNQCTLQSGPSVDRILEKGLPIFPKLDSLEKAATVNFYDKLQKTSALFLLPLMLFDATNLNMGFEGLCPPGLGLPQYVEIAGALMEVLPRLLPEMDSQVTSLVTVVRAESNNGYDRYGGC